MTGAERKLWSALRAHRFNGLHFRRQAPVGPFIADFVCTTAQLVIEVDGATHSTDAELARDARRETWLAQNGFRVLRFTNGEVYRDFANVLETVAARLKGRA
jgi:very-short-patch-repair endonuclease